MIRLKTLLITLLLPLTLFAQPQKARQAALTLTTYDREGNVIATAPGVFVTKDGMAMAAWTPFKDAVRAEVRDAKGRTLKVACLYGANAVYNVARFRVDGASDHTPLTPSAATAKSGTTVYIMGATPQKTAVSRTENFAGSYVYTVLESVTAIKDAPEKYDGAAVVTDKGELLGLYNYSASVQSCTDARYVNTFAPSALSSSDLTLKQTAVRIALPAEEKDAQLALMLAADRGGDYQEGAARDYIAAFPTAVDGYYSLATVLNLSHRQDEADRTMQLALQKASNKGEAHYDYSRIVGTYLQTIQPADTTGAAPYAAWSWEKAKSEADAAVAANPLPLYRQQQGEALIGLKKYQEAYDHFMSLASEKQLQGEPYYQAFIAKAQLGATNEELLPLLDQAIAASDTAYAANYFYARAVVRDALGKYRDALRDYIVYENLEFRNLTGAFYFQREQSERRGKFWQNALEDIAHAILLAPRNLDYWVEAASLNLQVGKHENAIAAAEGALRLSPDNSDALLIKGIVQCEQGQKADGRANIQKAKDLGNEQADTFLQKYK